MLISAGASSRRNSAIRMIFVRRAACSPTRCEVSTRSASSVGEDTIFHLFIGSRRSRQFVFEGRDPRTQSGILQLSVGVGRTVTQPGQHRALIGVEIGAGRMWPIERDREAAKPARDWNGKNGSPEAGR